jgi:uncharacterized protein YbjT (DUF2867 family)
MRVFLTGASGYIGGGAVKPVNAGAVVRGLVRDPGKAEALAHLGRSTSDSPPAALMLVTAIAPWTPNGIIRGGSFLS